MRGFWWLSLVLGIGCGVSAWGQQPLYNRQQQSVLRQLSADLQRKHETTNRRIIDLARQRNLPLREQRSDGTVIILQDIDERGNPLFDATHSATRAANTTHTSSLYSGGGLGLSLSGVSPTVRDKLAIWDGGKVRPSHTEFVDSASVSRIVEGDNATGADDHPTHVAGIMIGKGVNERARGMAFGARLKAFNYTNDDAEMTTAASNLLISNHSYGTVAGWVFNPDRGGSAKWEWHGDTTISAGEDYKFGFYNNQARDWDRIAFNAPYYLIVKSAGNNHGQNGPGQDATGAEVPHWLINRGAVSRTKRADQNGYDQIPTYSTSKNILTVGAVSVIPNGYSQPADVSLAGFSSWGPTDDGRIKPDLVGVGVNVLSSSAAGNNTYLTLSGTSMSSPNVSGSLLLLQEYYAQLHNGQLMRSSTLKSLALHTADEAGNAPGPDYRFGWGLLNAERAARVIGNPDKSHLLEERTLNQSAVHTVSLVASGRGPVVVTICWTDPEGAALTASVENLNNRTPRLVNDLDIRISDGSQTHLPWVLDPNKPSEPATHGDNVRDNVEQIFIPNTVPGKTYTLTIGHKGTLRNNRQEYALLVSGVGGKAYCPSVAASAGPAIDRVRFGTINQAGPEGCQTYTDFMATATTVSVGQQLPLEVTIGSCGNNRPSVTKAFIDWNADGDFDDPGEQAAQSQVLTTPATFTASITIPTGLPNGQLTRLRIVSAEAGDTAAVKACGDYLNGETQEYLLQIVRPQNDVGISAIVSPQNGFCNQNEVQVTVRLRNYGSVEQKEIPVTVQIATPDGATVATLTGKTDRVLGPYQEIPLTLRGTARLLPGANYRFTTFTGLPTDQDATNNQRTELRTTAADLRGQGRFTAALCGTGPVSLRNTGSGTAFWYDAPTGGKLLAAGNRASAATPPGNGAFYASLNEFSGAVGPTEKKAFGGGTYAGTFGPQPLISTTVPLVLEKARLYIGSPGKIIFTVRKYDETPVSSVTLDVTPTRNPNTPAGSPPAGQQSDDPDDPGAEYFLNLSIPEPGDYKIGIEYEDGATIFRSNVGVGGFPFRLAAGDSAAVRIKGALFQQTTGQIDTLRNAYYYLYDLKVRSLGCPASERTAVPVKAGEAIPAAITPGGAADICRGSVLTLQATEGSGYTYQWFRNGQAIATATASSLAVSTGGSYTVRVAGECLPVVSAATVVSVRDPQVPTITRDGYVLTSSSSTGNQWLLNGLPISGATQAVYTARESGRYSVRVNSPGCGELVSQEVVLDVITGMNAPAAANGTLLVSPNPAAQRVTVAYRVSLAGVREYRASLVDARGITVRTALMTRSADAFTCTFDVSMLPGGTFYVLIRDAGNRLLQFGKVLKMN